MPRATPFRVGVDEQLDAVARRDHVAMADHVAELPAVSTCSSGNGGLEG